MILSQEEAKDLEERFNIVRSNYYEQFKSMHGFEFSMFITLLVNKRELRLYKRFTVVLAVALLVLCVQVLTL